MVGSHSVIGFWLVDCMRPMVAPSMVAAPLAELVAQVAAGTLRPIEGSTYALSAARHAHEDMRARRTTGKVVLDPRLDGAHA
jgi:NADPH2:quinone reductase